MFNQSPPSRSRGSRLSNADRERIPECEKIQRDEKRRNASWSQLPPHRTSKVPRALSYALPPNRMASKLGSPPTPLTHGCPFRPQIGQHRWSSPDSRLQRVETEPISIVRIPSRDVLTCKNGPLFCEDAAPIIRMRSKRKNVLLNSLLYPTDDLDWSVPFDRHRRQVEQPCMMVQFPSPSPSSLSSGRSWLSSFGGSSFSSRSSWASSFVRAEHVSTKVVKPRRGDLPRMLVTAHPLREELPSRRISRPRPASQASLSSTLGRFFLTLGPPVKKMPHRALVTSASVQLFLGLSPDAGERELRSQVTVDDYAPLAMLVPLRSQSRTSGSQLNYDDPIHRAYRRAVANTAFLRVIAVHRWAYSKAGHPRRTLVQPQWPPEIKASVGCFDPGSSGLRFVYANVDDQFPF
ncbi:unnamed protein product [Mycena citricolor]|uniref:Uncharacterized protein n=1 Tax=Mycena citricolor TaxID=2018698 RepID=A0AAD2HT28_9AGAR|nr:unnamed protein product [Mycena citricolor]